RVANNSRILKNRVTTYGKRSVVSNSSSGANPDNNHYIRELALAVGDIVQELGGMRISTSSSVTGLKTPSAKISLRKKIKSLLMQYSYGGERMMATSRTSPTR